MSGAVDDWLTDRDFLQQMPKVGREGLSSGTSDYPLRLSAGLRPGPSGGERFVRVSQRQLASTANAAINGAAVGVAVIALSLLAGWMAMILRYGF
jgi:hypothetical protein